MGFVGPGERGTPTPARVVRWGYAAARGHLKNRPDPAKNAASQKKENMFLGRAWTEKNTVKKTMRIKTPTESEAANCPCQSVPRAF